MKIGFIGIGQMGKHMCRHLLEAGYDVAIHDLSKEAAASLLEKGGKWQDSPEDIAKTCQVVVSCLPGPPEVEKVVYGANGLMAGWKQGDIYVDMSTNSPTTVRRIAEDAKAKGVAVLDAPVSGGTKGAEAGTLAIMVGGDKQTLEQVRPILEAMGKKIFPVGDIGCGNIVKLVNNMIAATTNAIDAEGFVMGVKAGVSADVLREVIISSTGNNWHVESTYPQTILQGNFDPGFRINLSLKDMALALALGKECGVPLPVAATVEQRLLEAKAAGLGDMGSQSLILRLEELTGVQVRSQKK
jgi:2-hydroxymethylglutarate dehydrogenase